MQTLELVLVSAGALIAVALLATQGRQLARSDQPWGRALLGIVPGAIGALIILVVSVDLLPDDFEDTGWTVALVIVTALFVVGTTYRLARR